MNNDELIAEIKSQLLAELGSYKEQVRSHIPPKALKKAEQTRDNVREFIQENPWASVAIAAGIGFFLGKILGRQGDE